MMFPEINTIVESRLAGMRKSILASCDSGDHMSSATKGNEREAFVTSFLSQVYSPAYRFGTGNITSCDNMRSGQVDIVVESPFWYSLPAVTNGPRLYMAEGVAAVIEVKSNLMTQWDEVKATVGKVKQLRRRYRRTHLDEMITLLQLTEAIMMFGESCNIPLLKGDADTKKVMGDGARELKKLIDDGANEKKEHPAAREDIPCYAVGFTGWKTDEALANALTASELDGAMVLDVPMASFQATPGKKMDPASVRGEMCLSLFLDLLSFNIADVGRMIMPQTLNYSIASLMRMVSTVIPRDKLTDITDVLKAVAQKAAEAKSSDGTSK